MPSFQESLCQAGRSRSGAKQTGPPALGPHSARPAGPEQKANPVVLGGTSGKHKVRHPLPPLLAIRAGNSDNEAKVGIDESLKTLVIYSGFSRDRLTTKPRGADTLPVSSSV